MFNNLKNLHSENMTRPLSTSKPAQASFKRNSIFKSTGMIDYFEQSELISPRG